MEDLTLGVLLLWGGLIAIAFSAAVARRGGGGILFRNETVCNLVIAALVSVVAFGVAFMWEGFYSLRQHIWLASGLTAGLSLALILLTAIATRMAPKRQRPMPVSVPA